jgi:hypothetical protein
MVKQPVQKAAVAARVAVALDEGHELIDFGGREVFVVVPHVVQWLKRLSDRIRVKSYASASSWLDNPVGNVWGSRF